MSGPILLVLLLTAQDRSQPDRPEERARRAAIVDRVMAEPSPPDLSRPRRPAALDLPDGPGEDDARESQVRHRDENPFQNERRKVVVDALPRPLPPVAGPRRYLTLEPEQPPPAEEGNDLEPPEEVQPAQRPRANRKNATLGSENFDRWIFGDDFGRERRHPFLEERLAGKLAEANRLHHLTDPQREKLRLAGLGDIKRFFVRVEQRRRGFELARKDLEAGRQALAELLTLSLEFELGPFGFDSLFAKTLRKLENDGK